MMLRKTNFNEMLLFVIAICLIYIAFLKPLPNRYYIEKIEEDNGAVYHDGYEIFDTATGKVYINIHSSGAGFLRYENLIKNIVSNVVIARPKEKEIDLKGWEEANTDRMILKKLKRRIKRQSK